MHPDICIRESLLQLIRLSEGSIMFRHLYLNDRGRCKDILDGGNFACAYYVSCLLHQFHLIDAPHATIDGTLQAMKRFGWDQIRSRGREGDVLVWEPITDTDGEPHRHIGFDVGSGYAMSTSSQKKRVVKHLLTFGMKLGKPKRKVIERYRFSYTHGAHRQHPLTKSSVKGSGV